MSDATGLIELLEKLDQLVDALQEAGRPDQECELIGDAIAELRASTRIAMQILPAWLLHRNGQLHIVAELPTETLLLSYSQPDVHKAGHTWRTELHLPAVRLNSDGDVLCQAIHALMARANTEQPNQNPA